MCAFDLKFMCNNANLVVYHILHIAYCNVLYSVELVSCFKLHTGYVTLLIILRDFNFDSHIHSYVIAAKINGTFTKFEWCIIMLIN